MGEVRPFKSLGADHVWLAALRFQNCVASDLPLSPRHCRLVACGKEKGVERAAVQLACLWEADAARFDPFVVDDLGSKPRRKDYLEWLVDVVTDVQSCLRRALQKGHLDNKTLAEMKVAPKRLRNAERLWWLIDPKNKLQNSACSLKEIGPPLVDSVVFEGEHGPCARMTRTNREV